MYYCVLLVITGSLSSLDFYFYYCYYYHGYGFTDLQQTQRSDESIVLEVALSRTVMDLQLDFEDCQHI